MSSSLRTLKLEETLKNAKQMAKKLGVSRVTDTTLLDKLGLPVYASVRPGSQSLCVNAGKGLKGIEAQVGAYMEAIEFAMAEYGCSNIEPFQVTAREILDASENQDSILDLCPKFDTEIALDMSMWAVTAEDLLSNQSFNLPAELVFHPSNELSSGKFSSNTNGLSSGNTIQEATLHGLCELIERDTTSFLLIKDDSLFLPKDELPASLNDQVAAIEKAGLDFFVRYSVGQLGVPYFVTMISEKEKNDPSYMNGGYGCHPIKEIALIRSFCEAAQSRLTHIHGSRDDMLDNFELYKDWSMKERKEYCEKLFEKMSDQSNKVEYNSIEDLGQVNSIDDAIELLSACIRSAGMNKILRVVYTTVEAPIQVVRVIVPSLENFSKKVHRVGPRLRNFIENLTD